ncbi:putative protein kinase [Plasmopara halstedii]
MRAAVCELRRGRSGTRALSNLQMAVTTKSKVVSTDLKLTAQFRSKWRFGANRECFGRQDNIESWTLVSVAGIAIMTSNETLCEARKDEEIGATHGNSNVYDMNDNSDKMSIYFDAAYEPKKLLGSGTFGVVMQCAHKQTGRVSAVKMIQDVLENQEEVKRERMALERLERAGGHDCIVGYERTYNHDDFHYIVLEYVPGTSLYSFLKENRSLNTTLSLHLVSQLASALQFMHHEDIVHRDLKPENIMLEEITKNGENVKLKIIDFGSAGRVSQPESEKAHTTTLSGTRCYWPPEALQHPMMTTAMDMWALGCILYILISGRHPFDLTGHSTEDDVLRRVKVEPVSFLLPVWHEVPIETKDLILGLLQKDPCDRLTAEQVLEHPAMVGIKSMT